MLQLQQPNALLLLLKIGLWLFSSPGPAFVTHHMDRSSGPPTQYTYRSCHEAPGNSFYADINEREDFELLTYILSQQNVGDFYTR